MSTLIDYTSSITNKNIFLLNAVSCHESNAGNTSSACTIEYKFSIGYLLACDLKGVDKTCQANDSSAMLVIVEHGDWHKLLELLLNIEAIRCF